jgi:hypothetical protein
MVDIVLTTKTVCVLMSLLELDVSRSSVQIVVVAMELAMMKHFDVIVNQGGMVCCVES